MNQTKPLENNKRTILIAGVSAGFLAGVVAVSNTITYGVLIFAGSVPERISTGIGLALFSGFLLSLVVVLLGKSDGMIAFPQSAIAPILALLAMQISQDMVRYRPEKIFLTIIAALMISGVFVGAVFYLFGRYDLGDLIRFMPYPVVGGFLAGLGWLLVQGSVRVSLGGVVQLEKLFTIDKLMFWLPGILFGLIILVIQRKTKNYLVMPIMLIGGFALFYAVMLILGNSPAQMMAAGWLLGPFPDGDLWQPLSVQAVSGASWRVVFAQSGTILTLLITSLIGSLLNFSGIELATKKDVDLNRELRAAGVANMLVGLSGGMIGYPSTSISILANRVGARGRIAGVVTAAMFGVVLLFGTELLAFLPKPVISSMLVFVGMSFLLRWVVESRAHLPRTDYLVILFILAIIIWFGLLPGVAVGSVIMVILFVVNYSQIRVVRHELSGATFHSNVDRSVYHQRRLAETCEQIMFLKLQGFIFFGTAYSLLSAVRERAENTDLPPLKYLVLDFRLINGVDSSAMSSFTQMARLANRKDFTLVFSDVADDLLARIKKGVATDGGHAIHVFPNLDRSAEWCEERMLMDGNVTIRPTIRLEAQLYNVFKQADEVEQFISHLVREEFPEGYVLINQDDPPRGIYFIEKGKVTAQLITHDGKTIRLRTMGSGTIVGELGVYLGMHASAMVITEEPTVFYSLSVAQVEKMEQESPTLAAEFHRYMAKLMGERIIEMNQTVQALLE